MSEADIRWHNWYWIHDAIERINRDKRNDRRWQLLALCSSSAAAQGGESMEWWQSMVDATLTAQDKEEQRLARIVEDKRENEAIKQEKMDEFLRMMEDNGGELPLGLVTSTR